MGLLDSFGQDAINDNKPADIRSLTLGDVVQIILLILSCLWLLSFLSTKLPSYWQELQIMDSVLKAGLTPSGYSPTAQFIGGLLVPLCPVVLFSLNLYMRMRKRVHGKEELLSPSDKRTTGWGKTLLIVGLIVIVIIGGFQILFVLASASNSSQGPRPQAQEWTPFRSDPLGFTVMLPVEPTHNSTDLASGMHNDSFVSGNYDVTVVSLPKSIPLADPHTILKAFGDQMKASNPNMKVLTTEFVQFKGNPSLRLTTTSTVPSYTGNLFFRLIFANRKVYSFGGGGSEEEWKKLEDSFETLPSK